MMRLAMRCDKMIISKSLPLAQNRGKCKKKLKFPGIHTPSLEKTKNF